VRRQLRQVGGRGRAAAAAAAGLARHLGIKGRRYQCIFM
jgi:hypothetical protein